MGVANLGARAGDPLAVLALTALALSSSVEPASADARLTRLEIRQIAPDPQAQLEASKYCREQEPAALGRCDVLQMQDWLPVALDTDPQFIFAPPGYASLRYLIHFEYERAGQRCPAMHSSRLIPAFTRQILVNRFSLTAQPQTREIDILVLTPGPDGAAPVESRSRSCTSELLRPLSVVGLHGAANQNWTSRGDVDEGPSGPGGIPDNAFGDLTRGPNPTSSTIQLRGCTISEITDWLQEGLRPLVIDETGIDGRYDFRTEQDDRTTKRLAKQFRRQLGLEANIERREFPALTVDDPARPADLFLTYTPSDSAPTVSCSQP